MAAGKDGIVYQGPSRIDGRPILAIVTGVRRPSKNPKTGPMAQLWILVRERNPMEAAKRGLDRSVCGECPLRSGACYVTLKNAPLAVYRKWKRGGYLRIDPRAMAEQLQEKGQAIRLGAYGDPAAVPIEILEELTRGVRHTGYTHHWRKAEDPERLQRLIMASTEDPAGSEQAERGGWRTFRVRPGGEGGKRAGEIVCPASEEAGKRTTCEQCTLCNGKRGEEDRRRSVVISAHGSGKGGAIAFVGLQDLRERREEDRRMTTTGKRFGKARVPECACTYGFTCGPCLRAAGPTVEDPRVRGDDDGREYADPRDELEERRGGS